MIIEIDYCHIKTKSVQLLSTFLFLVPLIKLFTPTRVINIEVSYRQVS